MSDTPWALFRFCPRCGAAHGETPRPEPFHCEACGFLFFFNPAVAVAALVVRDDGRALFIRRAKEPARGRLANSRRQGRHGVKVVARGAAPCASSSGW